MRIRMLTLAAAALLAFAGSVAAQCGMPDKGQAKTVKGWVSDSACAAHGKKDCASAQHVADGAKLVLVTEDKKVWTITNPEMLAKHQGKAVEVKATTNPEKESITVKEVVSAKAK